MKFIHSLLFFLSLIALGHSYTIVEMNSVILDFCITDEVNPTDRLSQKVNGTADGLTTQERLFDLIAESMTTYCLYTSTQISCDLETNINRKRGDYAREITNDDYKINRTDVKIFLEVATAVVKSSNINHMTMVIYIMTPSGLDYFRWTEVVRVINANMSVINEILIDEDYQTTALLNTLIPPASYVSLLIDNNWQTSMIIAVVMLSASLIMFIVIVPLSRTDVCKPKPKTPEEEED